MRIVGLALLGLVFGLIAGAAIGVGLGLIWTTVLQTSCFEGYCGMLVFFTFMPIGSILGGLAGAFFSARRRPACGDRAKTSSEGPKWGSPNRFSVFATKKARPRRNGDKRDTDQKLLVPAKKQKTTGLSA